MYVIIAEGVDVDPELLYECVQLGLSGKVPIQDVKAELFATFRLQTDKDAARGNRTFVKEIARILSLFFSFPKQKGSGCLSRKSVVTEAYKAINEPEEDE